MEKTAKTSAYFHLRRARVVKVTREIVALYVDGKLATGEEST
jgi:hypothetical protein